MIMGRQDGIVLPRISGQSEMACFHRVSRLYSMELLTSRCGDEDLLSCGFMADLDAESLPCVGQFVRALQRQHR